jgi:hypothetical protein
MPMLALGILASAPEGQLALIAVVLTKRRKHMLAVYASMLPPRAGAAPCQLALAKLNHIEKAWTTLACNKVPPMLWIMCNDFKLPACALKRLNTHRATQLIAILVIGCHVSFLPQYNAANNHRINIIYYTMPHLVLLVVPPFYRFERLLMARLQSFYGHHYWHQSQQQ